MSLPVKALIGIAALWLGTAACAQELPSPPPTLEKLKAEAEYLEAKLECIRIEIACAEYFKQAYPSQVTATRSWLTPTPPGRDPYESRMTWVSKMLKKGYVAGSDRDQKLPDPSIYLQVAKDKQFVEYRAAYAKAKQDEAEKEAAFKGGRPLPTRQREIQLFLPR